MTKTLKTPSPHMKVTRKDRLRIATHEGVQNLNLTNTNIQTHTQDKCAHILRPLLSTPVFAVYIVVLPMVIIVVAIDIVILMYACQPL